MAPAEHVVAPESLPAMSYLKLATTPAGMPALRN